MMVNEDVKHDCDRHVKIFLTHFNRFDTALHGENHCTSIKCYNFMSLLNLPEVLSQFGLLRNLWEGGGQGERIRSLVKPTWIRYKGKHWQKA